MGHETKLTQPRGFILELGIMKSWFHIRARCHVPCAYYLRLDDLGPKMCFPNLENSPIKCNNEGNINRRIYPAVNDKIYNLGFVMLNV